MTTGIRMLLCLQTIGHYANSAAFRRRVRTETAKLNDFFQSMQRNFDLSQRMIREIKSSDKGFWDKRRSRWQQMPKSGSRFAQLGGAAFSSVLHEGWYTSQFLRTPPVGAFSVDATDTTPYDDLALESLGEAARESQREVDEQRAALEEENQSRRNTTPAIDVLKMLKDAFARHQSNREAAIARTKPSGPETIEYGQEPSTTISPEESGKPSKRFRGFKFPVPNNSGTRVIC
ncbi:MAG: uncharacterized protein KVP18_003331 [Porospora cf. gigantea A]|uniref:uncharacterized protein n=2 Tax=Porospora cf. gigantea A TaxID=2853593 RepID=UPI00355A22D2|nr:MAG: hypothetical protein KVP18_003331 [Porospora cf. gigantea A]